MIAQEIDIRILDQIVFGIMLNRDFIDFISFKIDVGKPVMLAGWIYNPGFTVAEPVGGSVFGFNDNISALVDEAVQTVSFRPQFHWHEFGQAFGKFADIDQISDVTPTDLDIAKEGNQVVISVAYEKKVKLFGPVSLIIDYAADTRGGQ